MAKKLPPNIYVKWNDDGDEPFLEPAEVVGDLAELGSTVSAGIYQLVKKIHIKSEIKLTEFTEK